MYHGKKHTKYEKWAIVKYGKWTHRIAYGGFDDTFRDPHVMVDEVWTQISLRARWKGRSDVKYEMYLNDAGKLSEYTVTDLPRDKDFSNYIWFGQNGDKEDGFVGRVD